MPNLGISKSNKTFDITTAKTGIYPAKTGFKMPKLTLKCQQVAF